MSTELEEFFAHARRAADSVAIPVPAYARHRGDRRRRRQTAVILCSVLAIVAATLGGVTLTTRERGNPHPATTPAPSGPPEGFATLRHAGTPIEFGAAGQELAAMTLAHQDRAYAIWQTKSPPANVVAAVDLRTGGRLWGPKTLHTWPNAATAGGWMGLTIVPQARVLAATRFPGYDPQEPPATTYLLDLQSGQVLWKAGRTAFIADTVLVGIDGTKLVGHDIRTGIVLWSHSVPQEVSYFPTDDAELPRAAAGPSAFTATTIAIVERQGRVKVLDVHTGHTERTVETDVAGAVVHGAVGGAVFFSTPGVDALPSVLAVGLDGVVRTVHTGPSASEVVGCFARYACLTTEKELIALDGDREVWRTDLGLRPESNGLYRNPVKIGDGYVIVGGYRETASSPGVGVASGIGEPVYKVVDRSGRVTATYVVPDDRYLHVDTARDGVILGPDRYTDQSRDVEIAAVTRDGTIGTLGHVMATGRCSAGDEYLICLDDSGLSTWSFR